MLTIYQLAKVLISRQQQGRPPVCQVKHGIIRNPWLHFGNVLHKMVILPKTVNDLTIYALICQEFHATASAIG